MPETSRGLDAFLQFLRESEQRYRMAEADEQEANAVTNDIHHSLELLEHDAAELLRLAEDLVQARRLRRRAKDVMSETAPVLAWLDENRPMVKSLERLLGEVRRAEKNTENRIYTPRARPRAEG